VPLPAYSIDALGWVQFERLCDELLRIEGAAPEWEGRADLARIGRVDDAVLAQVWVRRAMREQIPQATLVAQLAETLAKASLGTTLRLFTNVELTQDEVRLIGADAGYHGPHELSALIDKEPLVRRRVPSVLGVRNIDELITPELVSRSTADVAAARSLAPVFVPTRAHARALATLERHRFAVLSGPPEMGKTASARMIGLALMTEGWELHECLRPEDLWERFTRDRAQVFIADDAFGSTEYHPEAAERWALELDRVLRAMDERHWLIWTSRPAPLKAALRRVHREHGVERWPQPAEVHIAADDLDIEEKALILFRHAKSADLSDRAREIVRRHGLRIVSHPHFTPERIRRFVSGRLRDIPALDDNALAAAIEEEIREPTAAMAASLHALGLEHRALLLALVDVPPGPVPERELAAAARRHAGGGMPRPPGELVDRLSDHFLRIVPPASVTWVHPSWRDLVIDDLAADATARRQFLANSSINGLLLALSTGGGVFGERAFPLLIDDTDWDSLADRLSRLSPTLSDEERARFLSSLEAALGADPDEHTLRELHALAAETLELLCRRWDDGKERIEPRLLEAWVDVAVKLPEPPALPHVAPTWSELLPDVPPDMDTPSELNAFDDWLRLGALLRSYTPALAAELGFPNAHVTLLQDFIGRARELLSRAEVPATAGLVAQVLQRMVQAAPEAAFDAYAIAVRLTAEPRSPALGELPLVRSAGLTAGPAIVERILADL
jgi:hypothetical protein